jgi:uncharacterized membrane protein YdbT with pleckstrin-like domain
MSYVNRVLQPGEVVRHGASLHWILYVPGVLMCVLAGLIAILLPDPSAHRVIHQLGVIVALLCFAIGLVLLVRAWFHWWITEIAVTNRRVIYKTGFIRRVTTEINMDKVESVDVDQTILGRIFGYGDIYVHGTGEAVLSDLRYIAAPLELRNHITAG